MTATGAIERVPILTYHSLDVSGSTISTAPAAFRAQMETLRDGGWQGITLAELLAAWEQGRRPWPRPVVITFDDGLRSVGEIAAPILHAVRFRATLFVVAGRSGGDNQWPGQAAWAPRQDLLGAAELASLVRDGWEVGAHGLTHAPLRGLEAAVLEDEVARSKRVLEEQVGTAVATFAYPCGAAGPEARAAVARHYQAACSADLGFARPDDDRFWLPRLDAYYLRPPALLRRLDSIAARAYLGARALGRRARESLARP